MTGIILNRTWSAYEHSSRMQFYHFCVIAYILYSHVCTQYTSLIPYSTKKKNLANTCTWFSNSLSIHRYQQLHHSKYSIAINALHRYFYLNHPHLHIHCTVIRNSLYYQFSSHLLYASDAYNYYYIKPSPGL